MGQYGANMPYMVTRAHEVGKLRVYCQSGLHSETLY